MIEKVLQNHLARYPSLQMQDLYKLLHQAALASEHAVSDRGSVERWLTRELAEMAEGIPEPLIDPISPNGEIVRIHLRPYVAAGHDAMRLLDAFIRTANDHHGDVRSLQQYWQDAVRMSIFPVSEMNDFFPGLKAKAFPAVHHSAEYEKLYKPAYRVVSLALCPELRL
ncbi:MAG: hypothetical protein ACM3XO_24195 [Bacteroidota bacterium]